MKKKQIITMGIFLIGIFSSGCTQHLSKEVIEASQSASNEVTVDVETNYRQRLQLLNNFKRKVPMPFTNNNGKKDNNCTEGANTNTQICLNTDEEIITLKNSCEDSIGLLQQLVFRDELDNNETQVQTYTCLNSSEEKDVKKIDKHEIYTDKRYISIAEITNKSGKDKLPTNLDMIVKNTINTIGENYVLIDVSDAPKIMSIV